ncbi:hypothetical protein M0812_08918 [Anaeramoeba flamelloides]|uniref:Uncharacterized protein n=1 Tax=Anaeramoeba flamelloides TaxID=1746091 RepID=A0AAV7ZZA9_9EUKA|nr:hypothetical protein M0812_08918 [Anaeramoeba flamelloides]
MLIKCKAQGNVCEMQGARGCLCNERRKGNVGPEISLRSNKLIFSSFFNVIVNDESSFTEYQPNISSVPQTFHFCSRTTTLLAQRISKGTVQFSKEGILASLFQESTHMNYLL